jgi:threonine dehydratase
MGRRAKMVVRDTVVDGLAMVAIAPEDFELLDAHRRRVGAYQTRIARLRRDLNRRRDQMAEWEGAVAAAVAELGRVACECAVDPCARCAAIGALSVVTTTNS